MACLVNCQILVNQEYQLLEPFYLSFPNKDLQIFISLHFKRQKYTDLECILQVVQYKQQSRLEEKRKKALDIHLNFIVDQTEKYSTWLTEGLKQGSSVGSTAGSLGSLSEAGDG